MPIISGDNVTATRLKKPVNIFDNLFDLEEQSKLSGKEAKKTKLFLSIFSSNIPNRAEEMENIILYYVFGYKMDILSPVVFNQVKKKVELIEQSYKNNIASLIQQYDDDIKIITREYHRYLLQSSIALKLQEIAQLIFKELKKINNSHNFLCKIPVNSTKYDLIKESVTMYDRSRICIKKEEIAFSMCSKCNIKLTVDCDKGELFCGKCGLFIRLSGDIIETTDTIVQDNRPKNSSYDASNHCDFWYKRIFSLEPTELPDFVKPTVDAWLKKNSYSSTCENIRKALQKTGLSAYNNHVPSIRKLITGKSLEPPTHVIKLKIFNWFAKAVKAYTIVNENANIKYYPYFLWKIMEMIYIKDQLRQAEILQYIHLQNLDTLRKNDKIWRQMCDLVPEFTFISTDPNMQYIYED